MTPNKITINGKDYQLTEITTTKKNYVIEIAQNLEVYPHDLPETMTYVNAVEAVEKLGGGWRIPTKEELMLLYQHKDKIGGFTTVASSGSGCPDWYWSSTEDRGNSSVVHNVRFSDGNEDWDHKDITRLSCRPVRLVAAPAPSLG